MGAGPCDLCESCAKGKACPTPEKARPSMESCGLDVFTTVRNASLKINVVRDEGNGSLLALVLVD